MDLWELELSSLKISNHILTRQKINFCPIDRCDMPNKIKLGMLCILWQKGMDPGTRLPDTHRVRVLDTYSTTRARPYPIFQLGT